MAGKKTVSEDAPLIQPQVRVKVVSIIETMPGRNFVFNVDFRTLEDAERFQDALVSLHLSLIEFHFSHPLSFNLPSPKEIITYKRNTSRSGKAKKRSKQLAQ